MLGLGHNVLREIASRLSSNLHLCMLASCCKTLAGLEHVRISIATSSDADETTYVPEHRLAYVAARYLITCIETSPWWIEDNIPRLQDRLCALTSLRLTGTGHCTKDRLVDLSSLALVPLEKLEMRFGGRYRLDTLSSDTLSSICVEWGAEVEGGPLSLPRLQHLEIGCELGTNPVFNALTLVGPGTPSLVSLKLKVGPSDQQSTDCGWSRLQSLRKLEDLYVTTDYDTVKRHIDCISEQISSGCNRLKRFKLHVTGRSKEGSVDLSSLRRIPQLESLMFPESKTAPLQHCPNLTYLDITDWSPKTLGQIAQLRQLSMLTLRPSKAQARTVVQLPIITDAALPHLTKLSLHNPQYYDSSPPSPCPDGLDQLHRLPQLETLSLAGFELHSLECISSLLPRLRKLSIIKCASLVDISALELGTMLARLSLEDCAAVQDVSALSHCCGLLVLDLCGCRGVKDVTPLGSLHELQSLHMHNTDQHRITGLSCLNSLPKLDLSRCYGLSWVNKSADVIIEMGTLFDGCDY